MSGISLLFSLDGSARAQKHLRRADHTYKSVDDDFDDLDLEDDDDDAFLATMVLINHNEIGGVHIHTCNFNKNITISNSLSLSLSGKMTDYLSHHELSAGMVVDIKDKKNKWYEGTIKEIVSHGVHVHFNEWSERYDECIGNFDVIGRFAPLGTIPVCKRGADARGDSPGTIPETPSKKRKLYIEHDDTPSSTSTLSLSSDTELKIEEEHTFEPAWAATLKVTMTIYDGKIPSKMVLNCSPGALILKSKFFRATLSNDPTTKSIEMADGFSVASVGSDLKVLINKESVLAVFGYMHGEEFNTSIVHPWLLYAYHQFFYLDHKEGMDMIEPHLKNQIIAYVGQDPKVHTQWNNIIVSEFYGNNTSIMHKAIDEITAKHRQNKKQMTEQEKKLATGLSKETLVSIIDRMLIHR